MVLRKSILVAALSFFSLRAFAADASPHIYSDTELLVITGNKYASGELPLGDNHYVTDAPKRGYIYLCHLMQGGGGAQVDGAWIHGSTWNYLDKPSVQGQTTWNEAQFGNQTDGTQRLLSGNNLPINHSTGTFPVQPSDPAYRYDRNPNSITPQTVKDLLPVHPTYSDMPYCMGGEVGVMLTGVPLFNGFDAGMRDAAAHEVQDSCDGHPQQRGQYHYHSLSACIKNVGVKSVIGYALDGYPITGPVVATGHILNTDNLDECHGMTSEIIEDGQKKISYHYVMTQDFPYSVSCFRAKPVRTGPSNSPLENRNNQQAMPDRREPPAEALTACNGQREGTPCGFTSPRGDQISGTCRVPPGLQQTICIPAQRP